jgi:ferritin-like metal-binding protein YciE
MERPIVATLPKQTPTDLFVHERSSRLAAERGIEEMLGEEVGLVETGKSRDAITHHIQQTRQQTENRHPPSE